MPNREDLPEKYRNLIDWYEQRASAERRRAPALDPILALRGLGKEAWADEAPDAYVERLRRGWE